MLKMKTLTVGNSTYTVVDPNAEATITPDDLQYNSDTGVLYLTSNGNTVGKGVIVLSDGAVSSEQIQEAVNNYLAEHAVITYQVVE